MHCVPLRELAKHISYHSNTKGEHDLSKATQKKLVTWFHLVPYAKDGTPRVFQFSAARYPNCWVELRAVVGFPKLVAALRKWMQYLERRKVHDQERLMFDLKKLKGVPGVYLVVFGTVRELWDSMDLKNHGLKYQEHGKMLVVKVGCSMDLQDRVGRSLPCDYAAFFPPGGKKLKFQGARPLCNASLHHKIKAERDTIVQIVEGGEKQVITDQEKLRQRLHYRVGGHEYQELLIMEENGIPEALNQLGKLPDSAFGCIKTDALCQK